MLGTLDGGHRHPERFSRQFVDHQLQARRALGEEQLPVVRLHDLRHTAASLLLAQGIHPRLVMEVLGHSQIGLTMNTYSHVMPSMLGEAAASMQSALWGEKP